MELILDKELLQTIKSRAEAIQKESIANWGKMSVSQMFQHLNKSLDILFNANKKRMFIGRFLGKMILKKALKDINPISKNTPTAPSFVADDKQDFDKEKGILISYLDKFSKMKEEDFNGKIHPFFGKMKGIEWNQLIYKHLDHHFRQFEN